MNSEMFIKTPPTKLLFRCAVPAVITSLVFSFSIKLILAVSCLIGVVGFFLAEPLVSLIAPRAGK